MRRGSWSVSVSAKDATRPTLVPEFSNVRDAVPIKNDTVQLPERVADNVGYA
jgi:hypothetical protein